MASQPSDDVWDAIKLLWENTPEITYDEIRDYLTPTYGDEVPKSNGSMSKRKSKEKWVKRNPLKLPKKEEIKGNKQAKSKGNSPKKGNPPSKEITNISRKTNKAQKREISPAQEMLNGKLEEITDNVVMSAKERATIIVKHRKRWRTQGDIQDNLTSLALSLLDDLEDIDADPETIQKKIAVINILANTLDVSTRSAKIISEVELPLCGITPEDFSQSDQERRLGALEALGDINAEEEAARTRLKAELDDRLEWIKETANSGDFGRTPEPDNDDVEDIDYTAVDD
ncbi:hypothetical protein [Psychrobacter sp. ASPA161_6]|uniref:hypothetical protein n=1 Tax=Psychrobacter sp. ASPA161_6 TaxID=3160962 RepID=UPI003F81667A